MSIFPWKNIFFPKLIGKLKEILFTAFASNCTNTLAMSTRYSIKCGKLFRTVLMEIRGHFSSLKLLGRQGKSQSDSMKPKNLFFQKTSAANTGDFSRESNFVFLFSLFQSVYAFVIYFLLSICITETMAYGFSSIWWFEFHNFSDSWCSKRKPRGKVLNHSGSLITSVWSYYYDN